MYIKIGGSLEEVELENHRGSYLPMLNCGRREWYVAKDSDEAGEQAKKYWKDMAENDPKELACIVGEETLIQWGLGRCAGPGSTQVKSLEEWLDLWLTTPEEQWASYDGDEQEVESPCVGDVWQGCPLSARDRLLVEEGVVQTVGDIFTSDELEDLKQKEDDEGDLSELESALQELSEMVDDLGYFPTVAYRHN